MLIRQLSKVILYLACLPGILLLLEVKATAQANYNYYPNGSPAGRATSHSQASTAAIKQWFLKYDAVRRQAQMTPNERLKADEMMSKGLSIIVPGPEKADSQELLTKLVRRYQTACRELAHLPLISATEKLHRGYYQYFSDAGRLFSDYLRLEDNLFAVDSNGKPIAGQLLERKASLESLDASNKYMDAQVRHQFGIASYQY